jgi:outer membrane protein assembly factor BamB
MEKQEIDSSHEGEPQPVWNATFNDRLTSENFQRKGGVLYIGYASSTQQQEGQESNPFAKTIRLVALNRSNKHIIWQRTFTYEVEGMSVYTTMASWLKVVDDTVYLFSSMTNGASASWLIALDAGTGQEIWQHTGPGVDGRGMIVCNGRVFLHNTHLQALDGKTGKLLWSYGFMQNWEILTSSLSVTKDAIFFMGYSRASREKEAFVRSFHLTSGEERWNTPLGAASGTLSLYSATLLITEHTVYAIKGSNQLQSDEVIALRIQNGTRLWNSQNGVYEKPLLVENNRLFVSGGENLTALNASTGERLWTQRIEGLLYFSALPDDGLYGFNSLGLYLSCLERTTGKRLWFSKRGLSQTTGSCIAVDKTSIYMITNNHKEIYILDRETGNEQQFLQIDEGKAERFQIVAVG